MSACEPAYSSRCTSILVSLLVLGLWFSATGGTQNHQGKSVPFEITWPLNDPARPAQTNSHPLLTGSLDIWSTDSQGKEPTLHLVVTLRRPETEAARLFWNKSLAFPQFDWMRYVRVWDTNQQWLWPNLPFLLRLYGTERVDRYGGWDPGKEVDNDFAAVLIRKYNTTGNEESVETRGRPLVSAEWHPVGANTSDKFTVVHETRSDAFTLHFPAGKSGAAGRVLFWVIYADFMGAPVPATWPKNPEHDGAALVCFQVDWRCDSTQGFLFEGKLKVPPTESQFNWPRWVGRPSMMEKVRATPRLSDR